MRGIFAAGVLDVFHESKFDPFDLALGTSAGACNLASYLAGQHGRNRRCYTVHMTRPEFISAQRFLRGGHWLDLDWLWDRFVAEDPLDVEAVARNPVEFVCTATSARSGRAVYLRPQSADMLRALKASSAVPLLYRGGVPVEGETMVDGGVADALPVREAYRRGARRILVIRSRPEHAIADEGMGTWVGVALALGTMPKLSRAIARAGRSYRLALAFARHPPVDCTVLQVAPPRPLATARISQNRELLEHDYALGRAIGREAIARWRRLCS